MRIATGENWQLTEYEFFRTTRRNFIVSVREPYSRWQLSVYVGGESPWKIISFDVEDSDKMYNGLVSLDLIMAYMKGILMGHQSKTKSQDSN